MLVSSIRSITTLGIGGSAEIAVVIFSFVRYDLDASPPFLPSALSLSPSSSARSLHREKRRSPTPGHRELPTVRDCTTVDHLYLHQHDVPLHPDRLPESAALIIIVYTKGADWPVLQR